MSTPKEELNNIMAEMFMMIEDMEIQEGQYLQFAEMFKTMNFNIDRLMILRQAIQHNHYYTHYVRASTKNTTLRRKRLTEEQKSNSDTHILCNCGRYISKSMQVEHLQTQVHYQGRRNRKYALGRQTEAEIESQIKREVAIQAMLIRRLEAMGEIVIDNSANDEQGSHK